jgi:hypothetical protein
VKRLSDNIGACTRLALNRSFCPHIGGLLYLDHQDKRNYLSTEHEITELAAQ